MALSAFEQKALNEAMEKYNELQEKMLKMVKWLLMVQVLLMIIWVEDLQL